MGTISWIIDMGYAGEFPRRITYQITPFVAAKSEDEPASGGEITLMWIEPDAEYPLTDWLECALIEGLDRNIKLFAAITELERP